jgi:hypothetical protein
VSALDRQVGGSHYKDLAIQPVEFIERNNLSYLEGAIVKYVTRHRAKNGRDDLEKAKHCIDLLLQLHYDTYESVILSVDEMFAEHLAALEDAEALVESFNEGAPI